MKLCTPQIVWHSKDPVYSADFHHSGELWRLVTGGADKDIKASFMWSYIQVWGAHELWPPRARGIYRVDMEDCAGGEEGEGGLHGQSLQTHRHHQCCEILTQW